MLDSMDILLHKPRIMKALVTKHPNLWKTLREKSGLSQYDVADKCGVTQATISRLESGTGAPLEDTAMGYLTTLVQNAPENLLRELVSADDIADLKRLTSDPWQRYKITEPVALNIRGQV